MNIFVGMFYSFILVVVVLYAWYKYSNVKIDFKNYKLYVAAIGMTVITTFNFLVTNKYFRIMFITGIFILFYSLLFKEKIQKRVLTPMYIQFLTILSETIYTLILIVILKGDVNKILVTSLGTLLTNISVAFILFLLVHLKCLKRLYNRILRFSDKVNYIHLICLCFMLMLIASILVMTSYYKIEFKYYFLFNILMIIICIIIMINSVKTQNNYNTVSDNYNVAKNSLKDYEKMMTKYRVANHENKNLLLTIRAMSVNKDKNIPKYIDSIIENRFDDDEKLFFEIGVIPTGGLRATIYSGIIKIKENKIDYNLNIDKKISTVDLIELNTNTIIDMCKIIGVFIDNSIEAVAKLKKRVISIELYISNDKLCIKVSNNYSGLIDISRISDAGYTTKEKGHGYGLSLVKKIIDSNESLENETELSKKVFSQTLMVKYKKNH